MLTSLCCRWSSASTVTRWSPSLPSLPAARTPYPTSEHHVCTGGWLIVVSTTHLSASEMTFGLNTCRNFRNVITHNVIWANQKTESFVYRWLCTNSMFDVTYFSAFVRALDVISIILAISWKSMEWWILEAICFHNGRCYIKWVVSWTSFLDDFVK